MPSAVCSYCKEIKHTRRGVCQECITANVKTQTKLCTTCGLIQDWESFSNSATCLFGRHSKCKKCISHYDYKSMQNRNKFLRRMLAACKTTNKNRNNRGQRGLKFTWTLSEMVVKLEKLKDRCSYSHILMNFRPYSDWQCSPERIDNGKGYVDSNMTFICLEFQLGHHLQSSRELVDYLRMSTCQQHPRLSEITTGVFLEKEWVRHCTLGQANCKECQASWNGYYKNTAKGKLCAIAGHAKSHTTSRNTTGRNHKISEINNLNLLKMLQDQKGLCFWSGHHLSFETGRYDCISLERKNVNVGYELENCCLIMQCLNTTDQTSRKSLASEVKEGSGGWTTQKIKFLRSQPQYT